MYFCDYLGPKTGDLIVPPNGVGKYFVYECEHPECKLTTTIHDCFFCAFNTVKDCQPCAEKKRQLALLPKEEPMQEECPKRDPGLLSVRVKIEAFDPQGNLTQSFEQGDLVTLQFMQLILTNIFATGPQTVRDTSNATHSVAANSAASAVTIRAGTGTNPAQYNDYKLQTQTETVSGTVGSATGSGGQTTFNTTGSITATADRVYTEVGISVTVGGNVYLILHDLIQTTPVLNGGSLAVTYSLIGS